MSIFRLGRFIADHELTCTDQFAAWRRLLLWQFQSRLQSETIVTWIHGVKLAARRGMTGATGNIYAGLHEFRDMMFLLHFLRKEDIFADIGANVGTYSLLASGVCGAKSHAFEPDPTTSAFLRRNIEINRLDEKIVAHQIALGEADGIANFTSGLDTTNHIVTNGEIVGNACQSVQVRRADEMLAKQAPAFVKIDVEGHEEAVVVGASGLLSNPSLKALALETVSTPCASQLSEAGFSLTEYDPFQRLLSPTAGSSLGRHNTLFVRDIEFVRQRVLSAPPVEIFGKRI